MDSHEVAPDQLPFFGGHQTDQLLDLLVPVGSLPYVHHLRLQGCDHRFERDCAPAIAVLGCKPRPGAPNVSPDYRLDHLVQLRRRSRPDLPPYEGLPQLNDHLLRAVVSIEEPSPGKPVAQVAPHDTLNTSVPPLEQFRKDVGIPLLRSRQQALECRPLLRFFTLPLLRCVA